MGKQKGGFCCTPRKGKDLNQKQTLQKSPQSKELEEVYAQMEQVERANADLLKEIESMKDTKKVTT
jgi:hypothetical protein